MSNLSWKLKNVRKVENIFICLSKNEEKFIFTWPPFWIVSSEKTVSDNGDNDCKKNDD